MAVSPREVHRMLRRIKHALRPRTRWRRFRGVVAAFGVGGTLEYVLCYLRGTAYQFHPPQLTHPVFIRPFSSDVYVYQQTVVEREYAPVYGAADVRLVIDCGAN